MNQHRVVDIERVEFDSCGIRDGVYYPINMNSYSVVYRFLRRYLKDMYESTHI